MQQDSKPKAPLRVAILGTGAVAHFHADAVRSIPGATVTAAADPNPAQLSAFTTAHAIPAGYESLEALLRAEPIDVLHICTPPGGHAGQAAAAFAAGAHVVVEKPPALSLKELDEMERDSLAADRRLAVVFQQRSGSAAAHIRALLASGALGRPLVATCQTQWFRDEEYFSVPWRGTWETEGGGTTLSHGIHQIDLLAYLLGEWTSATGQLFRLGRDVQTEDTSMGTVVFANGAVASVVTTVLSPREASTLRIDTEYATIELEHLYGHDHSNWTLTPARPVSDERARTWDLPAVKVPSGHQALLEEVYAALLTGAEMPPVAAEPARALEIVTALYASARSGGPVSRGQLTESVELRGAMKAPVTDLRPAR